MVPVKGRLCFVAVLGATAFLLLWPGDLSAQKGGGSNFWPNINVEIDDYWIASAENVSFDSQLYANDVMYDSWVQFTPPEWFVAADADVPDGAYVGDTWDGMAVGLLNEPCNNWVNIDYQWQDATTNTANSFTYNPATTPISSPSWPGYGIMASGLERAVERYPAFLNTLFPGITPRARYYSHVSYAGTQIAAQYLIFQPGTSLPNLPSFDPGLGYPSLMLIQDPTAPPTAGVTTDICTSWSRNDRFWPWSNDNGATFANESGYSLRRNPSDWGNYAFVTFARPRPDADGDGIENDLDTCPLSPNWDENPRNGNGPDGDGLDSVCDPGPDVTNTDQDGDGYFNRGDNCPRVANTNQTDTDRDGIGDACDTHPSSVDGALPDEWRDFWVEVTGDSDGDGWSDALERLAGSNPGWNQSTPETLWRFPWTCSDGRDNDLDGLVDGYDLGCDRDGDRVPNMFDACPEDPEDWDGFEDSDGCPDNDNDMDGVNDWNEGCLDVNHDGWCDTSCMNIPEDYDSYQDWDGCPDADNDDDGFPDVTDECPSTDWTAGPDGIADTGDEPLDTNGVPIQTREDYDGIIDWDGCHDSPGDDYDGDSLGQTDDAGLPVFRDEVEVFIGTDPADACPDVVGSDDAWPLDINMDRVITVAGDVYYYAGCLGARPGDPNWWQRLDFNMDSFITVTGDVFSYRGMNGKSCT